MSTVLLAQGTTAASSSDLTLAADEAATLFLTTPQSRFDGSSSVNVEIKGTGAVYYVIGQLTPQRIVQRLSGPGTFRVSRKVCTVSIGVEQA